MASSERIAHARGLLVALADGRLHSGAELARALGVTRAAVWKQLSRLKNCGLAVEAIRGRGYRLRRPLDLLDENRVRRELELAAVPPIGRLESFLELESTNAHLLSRSAPTTGQMEVCLAEYQSAGRGRRGRRWSAPLGGGLCLSVAWRFESSPASFSCLSLALGVVVRRVLKQLADVEIGLKWPNDLVFDGRKLGGILVEFTAEAQGACHVVAGIGLNVAIPKRELDAISDWPGGAIDLDSITTTSPGRCRLAAGLIAGCGTMFEDFEAKGFAPYKAEWHTAHVLTDRDVRVTGALATTGRVVGISEDGALLLATESGQSRIVAGDVSLRLS